MMSKRRRKGEDDGHIAEYVETRRECEVLIRPLKKSDSFTDRWRNRPVQ